MSSKDKFLYIVDYWVPFPSSEYGGIVNVIAESDQECFEILSEEESFPEDHGHLIMEQVIKSTKLKLSDDYESDIIDAFIT
mgnify:FL=1